MVESEDGEFDLEGCYIQDCMPELLELTHKLEKMPKDVVPRLARQLQNVKGLLAEQGMQLKLSEPEMVVVGAIHQTNGLSIVDISKESEAIGHCLAVSAAYFNHSCLSNCLWEFDHVGYLTARADGDIEEGEELTFSYVGHATYDERQKGLDPYGFQCKCSQCVPGTPHFHACTYIQS